MILYVGGKLASQVNNVNAHHEYNVCQRQVMDPKHTRDVLKLANRKQKQTLTRNVCQPCTDVVSIKVLAIDLQLDF